MAVRSGGVATAELDRDDRQRERRATSMQEAYRVANEKLQEMLRESVRPGTYGRRTLSVLVQDGVIQMVETTIDNTHKINPAG